MNKANYIPENLYKQIVKAMPIPCVDAVIMSGGKFLLGKRVNQPLKNKWWLPGGRVFKNEPLEKAVIRKVREETGLSGKIISQLGTEGAIFRTGPFGFPVHTINTVFLLKISGKTLFELDAQHNEFKWFEQIAPSWHPYIKKFLHQALKYHK